MASAEKIAKNTAPDRSISPALKSWIKNCVVPILVREYLTDEKIEVVSATNEVVESLSTSAVKVGQ
jgi:hypothetical protein